MITIYNIPKEIKTIMSKLIKSGYKAYIVGGAVRDTIMGLDPYDWDIFTNATGKDILKVFPQGKVLGGVERQEKILTVIVDGVEVSQFRRSGDRTKTGTTLTEHLGTCDFTINSMAANIEGKVSDPYNGAFDIAQLNLKFVGDGTKRINEDILRILRGIRFIIKYGFIDNTKIIDKNLHLLKKLPLERVGEELKKILSITTPYTNDIHLLYNVFSIFIPELEKCTQMNGGSHHNELVGNHLMNSLMEAFKITNNPLIRLSAFLHDIGKSVTKTEEGDEIHFYQHETESREIAEKFMTLLKFSTNDISYVSRMVKAHMYSYEDSPSDKSHIKFFNKLETANIDIMDYVMLLYSDHQGNLAKPRIKFGDFVKGNRLHRKYYELKYKQVPFKVHDMIVGGKDLIEKFNMKPGIEMGVLLKQIHEKIMDGDISNDKASIYKYIKGRK